jgi:hypothetical protein
LLAKLDNLGPFQLFFTLSCADMRWDENFAAIIREKNYAVTYTLKPDGENFVTKVTIKMADGKDKRLREFLAEDVDESLHEFIRNNVLVATWYFRHRVRVFIQELMLGKNNPMNVNYHMEKTDFQDHGAGHIHGTLWLKLKKIDKLVKTADGSLENPPKIERNNGPNDKEEEDEQECPEADLETPFNLFSILYINNKAKQAFLGSHNLYVTNILI